MLVFSTGTTSSGNSGAIYIGTGAATTGRGGSITISVGTGNSGVGGDLTLKAGGASATSTLGGSVLIYPGAGTNTASGVYVYDGASTERIVVTSSTIKLSGGTVDIDSTSTVTVDATTSIALTAPTVTFSTSALQVSYGAGSASSNAVTVDTKVTGLITSSTTTLGAGTEESIVLTNSYISATTSIVIAHVVSQCSSGRIIVLSSVGGSGFATITVRNDHTSACSSTYTIGFLVLNNA